MFEYMAETWTEVPGNGSKMGIVYVDLKSL